MESTFPFGFPGPTAFYLVLYVATFALHQTFMHYVLAGSLYVAWATMFPGSRAVPRGEQPLASTLRDWMPFMLSAAITAGVAPLLFVQITYPKQFYTANLLLWWRWMIVVPVLVTAFYLLYVLKGKALLRWPLWARSAVGMFVAGSFLFVGFCWTANHLISTSEGKWPEIYATGQLPLAASEVILRMLIWTGGALASMAVIAGWQLIGRMREAESRKETSELTRLATLACGGLAIGSAAAAGYYFRIPEHARELISGRFGLPYLVATILGVLMQGVAWIVFLRKEGKRWPLVIASVGWMVSLLSISVLREAVRLARIDMSERRPYHAEAGAVGGFTVFILFTLINGLLIAGCIWLVRRALREPTAGNNPD